MYSQSDSPIAPMKLRIMPTRYFLTEKWAEGKGYTETGTRAVIRCPCILNDESSTYSSELTTPRIIPTV
jgi:hypothetical protein